MTRRSVFLLGLSGSIFGLLVAVGAFAYFGDGGAAAPTEDGRPRFLMLTTDAVASNADTPEVATRVALERVNSAAEARAVVRASRVAGIVLDKTSLPSVSIDLLRTWYASGKVIVAFNVEHTDLLRAVDSANAFPDLGKDQIPEATLNPDKASGSFAEPFFSVVYRSQPSGGGAIGGETTQPFSPALFAEILEVRALNAQGLVIVDGTVIPAGRR